MHQSRELVRGGRSGGAWWWDEMRSCLHVMLPLYSGTLDPIAENIIGLERAGDDMCEGGKTN
jgi:hypothetical protein